MCSSDLKVGTPVSEVEAVFPAGLLEQLPGPVWVVYQGFLGPLLPPGHVHIYAGGEGGERHGRPGVTVHGEVDDILPVYRQGHGLAHSYIGGLDVWNVK